MSLKHSYSSNSIPGAVSSTAGSTTPWTAELESVVAQSIIYYIIYLYILCMYIWWSSSDGTEGMERDQTAQQSETLFATWVIGTIRSSWNPVNPNCSWKQSHCCAEYFLSQWASGTLMIVSAASAWKAFTTGCTITQTLTTGLNDDEEKVQSMNRLFQHALCLTEAVFV